MRGNKCSELLCTIKATRNHLSYLYVTLIYILDQCPPVCKSININNYLNKCALLFRETSCTFSCFFLSEVGHKFSNAQSLDFELVLWSTIFIYGHRNLCLCVQTYKFHIRRILNNQT